MQLKKLGALWPHLRQHPLYAARLAKYPKATWDAFRSLPLLTKSDIQPDNERSPSKLFTLPRDRYTRLHQTSGSRGFPMPVLDTNDDWRWWLACWQSVLDAADVNHSDVAMMAFSFGPFIGFWTAHEALIQRGVLVVPGGGLSSEARLELMIRQRCTVVCCTPTYALHLASIARQQSLDLAGSSVRTLIVAGEPGGSVPAVADAISEQWNARVVDHAGASEMGAWGFATDRDDGLHVLETEFIAEFRRCDTDDEMQFWTADQAGREPEKNPQCELVLSNLGRFGGPLMRYRTGDLVRPRWDHSHSCPMVKLDRGVLGRADDMMVIRGVNVFPSSIEAIIREREPTVEFRMIATRENALDDLRIEIECDDDACRSLAMHLRDRLAMRVTVTSVPQGSLPRSEAKSKRWIDRRESKLDA
ncbi:MAG: AMP-binding protein [Planctomycetota bacterium]